MAAIPTDGRSFSGEPTRRRMDKTRTRQYISLMPRNVSKPSKPKAERERCELMTNPDKRADADKLAASIEDGFPPGVSRPALRALANAGYTRLDQLVNVSEADLRKLHGMGPKAIGIMAAEMKKRGMSFRNE